MITPARVDRRRATLFSSVAAVALSLTFANAAQAAPIVITFDPGDAIGGVAAGTILSNQYAGVGVTFTPNAFTGSGGAVTDWATNTDLTVRSSTGGDVGALGLPALASGNVLHSLSGYDSENGDASFRATFTGGVTFLSATFAGILNSQAASTRLFAYNGTTLVTTAMASRGAAQQVLTVSSATAITSVVFTPGDFFDYVAVDNITFELIPVPAPTSMVLLGAGLAAVARRRRR